MNRKIFVSLSFHLKNSSLLFILFLGFVSSILFVNCSGYQTENSTPGLGSNNNPPDGQSDLDKIFALIPNLVICQPVATPFIEKSEVGSDTIYYQSCTQKCENWEACTMDSTVRGRAQTELYFVVDEDGTGNGFGGTLRFTKAGDKTKLVMFHKGGSGTDWVDDYLPNQVELAGGIAFQPKWFAVGTGWFMRPYSGSMLERNLAGTALRPAAVMKWVYKNLTQAAFSSAACSGGSIATYYPRHWYGLDPILKYQLLGGGPVMAKIEGGCRGGQTFVGRCTQSPTTECNVTSDCGMGGGLCSPYEWGAGATMSAVRLTIDQLHLLETGTGNYCFKKLPQPLFNISDFDNPIRNLDYNNEHKIDFLMNVSGDSQADNGLNVISQGALVFSNLTGPKSWNVEPSGIHCDATNGLPGWNLLKVGAGL